MFQEIQGYTERVTILGGAMHLPMQPVLIQECLIRLNWDTNHIRRSSSSKMSSHPVNCRGELSNE